jgi:pimeloyl-ACP methyl ester carboxylesterase
MTVGHGGETVAEIGVQRWTETGSGPTVLLLHGIYAAAGGHEWSRLVPALESSHAVRVRVPDLLGFGGSERPARQFTAALVGAAVAALIDDVPADSTIVASSLTAAYALAALDRRARTGRCVLITPTGLGRAQTRAPAAGAALEALWRRTPVGDALARALTSGPSLRWFLRNQAYADAEQVTDKTIADHRAAADDPNLKYPLVAFVAGQLACAVDPFAVARVRPTVLWGVGQSFTSTADADRWEAAGASVHRLASGLPQAEEPDAVAERILAAVSG